MPLYEFYCPPCSTQFEVLCPASKIDEPAICPSGHTTNNRVLSLFAPIHKSTHGTSVATMDAPEAMGDACCSGGGACSCC